MATVQEVLDQVGDDPVAAQEALDAELASDNPRTTLISQLETIASKEADVTDDTATVDEVEEIEEPQAPRDVEINLGDSGLTYHPAVVRDGDVEIAEGDALAAAPADWFHRSDEDTVDEALDGEQVEWIAALSGPNGLALAVNGQVLLVNAQMTANLKQIVDKAVAGLAL